LAPGTGLELYEVEQNVTVWSSQHLFFPLHGGGLTMTRASRFSKCIALSVLVMSSVVLGGQAPPYDLDRTVATSMSAFNVPGMAVAVVKDGQVVSARGYGVKTLGQSDPVDDRTLFGIASNTKVFTAAALGTLIDEDRFTWNTRVIDVVPTFRLSDPYVTQEMTIRDLLVHRSGLGLGAGDLLWWPASTYTRKEIVARLANIPLATSFRSAYAYDNVLYLVAAEVIEAVSGRTWEDYVQHRLLDRIGMTTSAVHHSAAACSSSSP
jgi:CubicO group peptidase (beta-lactamase class C family)